MKHSKLKYREDMFYILCSFLKEANLWEKVTILDGSYYENFIEIKEYVKEILK